jgi:hypothetical protein
MPVLHRVVGAGRSKLALAGLLLLAGLAGCSRFDAALGKQQAIVSFRSGTPVSDRLAVRAACANLPSIRAQKVPDLKKYPYALDQLTFTTTNASNAQVVTLERCLQKFPSVAGVTLQDSSDTGG